MRFLFALLLVSQQPALAGGKAVGNGGDEVALSFQSSALRAIEGAGAAGLLSPTSSADLRAVIFKATILTTDQPLLATTKEGVQQESVAVNIVATSTVIVNRFRWLALANSHTQEAIALHETLSLRGMETTGDYHLSGAYAAQFLVSAADLQPSVSAAAQMVGCPDYDNILLSVTALRGGMQTMKISPVSVAAHRRVVNFLGALGIAAPEDISDISFNLATRDCLFDPRIRGKMDCTVNGELPRPGTLTLSRNNGALETLGVPNLSFRVATPFQRVTPSPNVIAFVTLDVAVPAKPGVDAELFLFLKTRACR